MLKIYGIPNCDTMKKAFDHLKEKGIEYDFFNYKTCELAAEKLENWVIIKGLEVILNKKSTTYKELDASQVPKNQKEALAIMLQKNSMIKRPVIEYNGQILVGLQELKDASV